MTQEFSPTKANLLVLREALHLTEEGHELLSQKREILIGELTRRIQEVQPVREETGKAVSEAYSALRLTLAQIGSDGTHRLAETQVEPANMDIQERSVMGVPIPFVQVRLSKNQPLWGLGETPAQVDEVVLRFRALLVSLGKQAQVESTVRRLATELAKTQKRTNALEHVVIPEYCQAVKFIQDTLEEREREAHFQLKRGRAIRRR